VGGDTPSTGHAAPGARVECGVIHRYHPKHTSSSPQPVRCLRHSVWMAVCDDCRAAHAETVSGAEKPIAAAR
jgi:hypothetical protein